MTHEDKGKKESFDQSDLMGIKPFASIGPDRDTNETKVVEKLKNKKSKALRADGSTIESGQKANVGEYVGAIKNFVNR